MRTISAVAVVAFLIIAVIVVFIVITQQSTSFTNRIECTDNIVIVYAGSTFTNGSQASQTVTTVSSFTTMTNVTTTAGHVASENLAGYVPLTGEATTQRLCTFVTK
jgi:hypothetical protein